MVDRWAGVLFWWFLGGEGVRAVGVGAGEAFAARSCRFTRDVDLWRGWGDLTMLAFLSEGGFIIAFEFPQSAAFSSGGWFRIFCGRSIDVAYVVV